jgi:pilus assembly protein Flp/PilA
MRQFAQHVVKFLKAEDGPTAVEYSVMIALVVIVCITAIAFIGSGSSDVFNSVGSSVSGGT